MYVKHDFAAYCVASHDNTSYHITNWERIHQIKHINIHRRDYKIINYDLF